MDTLKKGSTTFEDSALFFRTRKDTNKDYYNRALGAFVGLFDNLGRISTYFAAPRDDQGEPLDGRRYSCALTITKDQILDVKNFWSWTMYKLTQRWLVDNPLCRYSIGSATPGLKTAGNSSITLYDVSTRAIITNKIRKASVNSRMKLQANKDGSVDLYFGPKAPKGKEPYWMETTAGKAWFPYFRLYSQTQAFLDQSWISPDIQKAM
jgi:hypothetical protein